MRLIFLAPTVGQHRQNRFVTRLSLFSLSLSLSTLSFLLSRYLNTSLRADCCLRFTLRGKAHRGVTGEAVSQWWPKNRHIAVSFSVRAMSCFLDAREQSTGLATAGATKRPRTPTVKAPPTPSIVPRAPGQAAASRVAVSTSLDLPAHRLEPHMPTVPRPHACASISGSKWVRKLHLLPGPASRRPSTPRKPATPQGAALACKGEGRGRVVRGPAASSDGPQQLDQSKNQSQLMFLFDFVCYG